jgi:hypothetical protein
MQTAFRPSVHGFPFPNYFDPGTPVVVVPSPMGEITIGDAHYGLCGGMIFAALDFFLWGQRRYEERDETSTRYFARRLIDSWNLPFGVLRYYEGQSRPGASKSMAGVRLLQGLTRLTLLEEWPKVRETLDRGMPAAIGLVNVWSYNPKVLGQNHQVLGYGYTVESDRVTVAIYDPNHPHRDDGTLSFHLNDPDAEQPIIHNLDRAARGFFLTQYTRPPEPPPAIAAGADEGSKFV